MTKLVAAILTFGILFLTGCNTKATAAAAGNQPVYRKISAEQARKILDQNPQAVVLDVRTEAEFIESHIPGAKLIPNAELQQRALQELPDKNAVILIYCRSGHRSQIAADLLIDRGYTNVYDFGGIISYPYDTIRG